LGEIGEAVHLPELEMVIMAKLTSGPLSLGG
jgi:hypothetical protein